MIRHEYGAGAVKWALWFLEFRATLELLSEGLTWDEIKKKVETENLYGTSSKARALQIFSSTKKRLALADEGFIKCFLEADLASKKLAALGLAMLQDSLLFDLVYEVIRDKLVLHLDEFSDGDIKVFFMAKQQQNEKAATWTEATIDRLIRSYRHMMSEGGLIVLGKGKHKINKILMDSTMVTWFVSRDYEPVMAAVLGR